MRIPYQYVLWSVGCPICKVGIGEVCIEGKGKRTSAHKERWSLAQEIYNMKIVNCISLGEMCEAALDGEPVFIIRAKDKLAIEAVEHYLSLAVDNGCVNTGRSRSVLYNMNVWREKHPNKVKLPD